MNPASLLLLGQVAVDRSYDLTPGGWIVMILSVGFVTCLLGWCVRRVVKESSLQKVRGPADIDTRDTNGS